MKAVRLKLLSIIPFGNAHPGGGLWVGKAQLLLSSSKAWAERSEQGSSSWDWQMHLRILQNSWLVHHSQSAQGWFHPAAISLMLTARVKFQRVGLKQDRALEDSRKMLEQQVSSENAALLLLPHHSHRLLILVLCLSDTPSEQKWQYFKNNIKFWKQ